MIRGARVNPAKSLVERRIQLIYHLSNRVMLKPLEDHVNKISATNGKKTKQDILLNTDRFSIIKIDYFDKRKIR